MAVTADSAASAVPASASGGAPTGPFYALASDGQSYQPVNAAPVTIPGADDLDLGLHPALGDSGGVVISEGRTGRAVGSGPDPTAAMAAAAAKIAANPSGVRAAIDRHASVMLSPRYADSAPAADGPLMPAAAPVSIASVSKGDILYLPSGTPVTVAGKAADGTRMTVIAEGKRYGITPAAVRKLLAAPPMPLPNGAAGGSAADSGGSGGSGAPADNSAGSGRPARVAAPAGRSALALPSIGGAVPGADYSAPNNPSLASAILNMRSAGGAVPTAAGVVAPTLPPLSALMESAVHPTRTVPGVGTMQAPSVPPAASIDDRDGSGQVQGGYAYPPTGAAYTGPYATAGPNDGAGASAAPVDAQGANSANPAALSAGFQLPTHTYRMPAKPDLQALDSAPDQPQRDVQGEAIARNTLLALASVLASRGGPGNPMAVPAALTGISEGFDSGADNAAEANQANWRADVQRVAQDNAPKAAANKAAEAVYKSAVGGVEKSRETDAQTDRNAIEAFQANNAAQHPYGVANEAEKAQAVAAVVDKLSTLDPAGKQLLLSQLDKGGHLAALGMEIPKKADGSYDVDSLQKAVSPNVPAAGALQMGARQLGEYYSEAANPRVTPERQAQLRQLIPALEKQLGGPVDPLSSPLFSDMDPYQRSQLALGKQNLQLANQRERFTEAAQTQEIAQRAAGLSLQKQAAPTRDLPLYGQLGSAYANLSRVNAQLAPLEVADPTLDNLKQRETLMQSRAALLAQIGEIGKARPDIIQKIGGRVQAGGGGMPAAGAVGNAAAVGGSAPAKGAKPTGAPPKGGKSYTVGKNRVFDVVPNGGG